MSEPATGTAEGAGPGATRSDPATTGGAGRGDVPAGELPEYVVRPPAGFYRSLNPTTKLVIAIVEVALAFILPGWVGPLLVLGIVLAVTLLAGRLRRLALVGLASAPIVGSILLIDLFLLPGARDPIVRVGPLAPTWSGLVVGVETALRLLAFSFALALVYLTTAVDDLLADLARRGVGRRAVFVVGSAVETVPRTIERAAEIVDAQRARGLDTEGRFWQRARGVVPLAAPVVFGALTEVEERTMALEARAFSAPVRQTLLRIPNDSPSDRLLRWLAVAVLLAAVAIRLSGRVG